MVKKHLYLYVLVTLYVFIGGCVPLVVGAGAGAAGVVWQKGALQETISASVRSVHQAAKAGLKDLHITITEDRVDNLTAEIRGLLADERKVWVDAESINASTTKLSIRVGTLGDKTFALHIRDAIKKHL